MLLLVEGDDLFDHYKYPLFTIQYDTYLNVILWALMVTLIHWIDLQFSSSKPHFMYTDLKGNFSENGKEGEEHWDLKINCEYIGSEVWSK